MPARNAIKQYVEHGYYHLYNRGVEKRRIFIDTQDYNVFLNYLKEYLTPKDEEALRLQLTNSDTLSKEKDKILKLLRLNNFNDEMMLLAFCLMPNHFHFFVHQNNSTTIHKFMRSIGTRYTMYFNHKYKRVGALFQSVYKAVLVQSEGQFLHLSRYIHKQALASQGESLQAQPSSYDEYIGKRKTPWVHPEKILNYFSKNNPSLSYKTFVHESEDGDMLRSFML